MTPQRWIVSSNFDLAFIIAPAYCVTAIVLLFPNYFEATADIPLWFWVFVVVGIDAGHVYSTLFRTYFDREEFQTRRVLYTLVPVLAWVGGSLVYSFGASAFWTLLAYIAVFHFIRQQYGFMMLYARDERDNLRRRLNQAAVYLATLYPLVYWHAHLPRQFNWFVPGDFVFRVSSAAADMCLALYLGVLAFYTYSELRHLRQSGELNIPKNLLLIGTILSWYVGIVVYNGDMAFTLTNIVSHGIPYIALIWMYQVKKFKSRNIPEVGLSFNRFFQLRFVPLYVLSVFFLAYSEEFVWDLTVWREHCTAFASCGIQFPALSRSALTILVPLLTVPQLSHYILDGFIWKLRKQPDRGLAELLH